MSVSIDLRGHVELRVVGRSVQAEHEAFGRHGRLLDDIKDALLELGLVFLARGVPRRQVDVQPLEAS